MLINIIVLILSAFFAQFVQGQQKMSLFETISRIEEKYPDLRNMNLESAVSKSDAFREKLVLYEIKTSAYYNDLVRYIVKNNKKMAKEFEKSGLDTLSFYLQYTGDAKPKKIIEVIDNIETFGEWVNEELVYPEIAKENGVSGKVVLQFKVNTDGSVSNVKVIRGIDPALDREAIRVVSMSPKWTITDGQELPATYTYSIVFALN